MLDIIIPHYTEPWDVGRKLFDMLDLQRDVDFGKVHVILVNDGEENALPDTCFADRPYKVEQISIPHAGVSAARNAGLRKATHEWVMFCDFDDVFSNVYALRDIMTQLPAPDFDALWTDVYVETKRDSRFTIVPYSKMTSDVHGKLYRRSFLNKNELLFDTDLVFAEDHLFNIMAFALCDKKRSGKIETKTAPYIWCLQAGSVTSQLGRQDEKMKYLLMSNIKIYDFCNRNGFETDADCMLAKTVWDAYYSLNVKRLSDQLVNVRNQFSRWYLKNKTRYDGLGVRFINHGKNSTRLWFNKRDFCHDITIDQWLDEIERSAT